MNRSLLTLGLVLSLGSLGCAAGLQSSSALTGQYRVERGVDDLWIQEEAGQRGAETPLYAEQGLGTLWGSQGEAPPTVVERGADAPRGGDLWNPAPVARSVEPSGAATASRDRATRAARRLWY
jgi:hypothetical protein